MGEQKDVYGIFFIILPGMFLLTLSLLLVGKNNFARLGKALDSGRADPWYTS